MRITAIKDSKGNKLWLANLAEGPKPGNSPWPPTQAYRLWFGAYGPTSVLVYANSFEDALEEAAEFCVEKGWRGLVSDEEEMTERYRDACKEHGVDWADFVSGAHMPDGSILKVLETAEEDMTRTESGWIPSEEWGGTEETDPVVLARLERAIALEYDHLDWRDW